MPIGPLAILFLSLVGYVLGLMMLRRARWRGTNFRVCRACGYDVRGLGDPDDDPTCPECSARLSLDAVEWATRRHDRRPFSVSAFLLVFASSIVLTFSIIKLMAMLA